MKDPEAGVFSTGLCYEDRLPLRWQPVAALPEPAGMLAVNRANEHLLRNLAALEESHSGTGADEDGQPVHQDLQRLEHKLDLLMEMIGQFLGAQLVLPEPMTTRLGADAMQWDCALGQAPTSGSALRVEVFPDRRFPSPLVFFGSVEWVRPRDGGMRVELRYDGVGDALRSALEKIIFRQHRRLIAQQRQRQGARHSG